MLYIHCSAVYTVPGTLEVKCGEIRALYDGGDKPGTDASPVCGSLIFGHIKDINSSCRVGLKLAIWDSHGA